MAPSSLSRSTPEAGGRAPACGLLDRRTFLAGFVAVAACRPHTERLPAPTELAPISLGWRWVPGAEHAWRVIVTRDTPRVRQRRAEEWSWLAREVRADGDAVLEGRMTGLGAGVDIDGEPLPDDVLGQALAAERTVGKTVTMRMSIDGRLRELDAVGFAVALPHRLLAQQLPVRAVRPGDPWSDAALPRTFTDLFPIDLATRMRGEARLVGPEADGLLRLATSGHARAEGGPAIALRGHTLWDAEQGLLAARELVAEFRPMERDPVRAPGALHVRIERVG